jgi:hypothetical protein
VIDIHSIARALGGRQTVRDTCAAAPFPIMARARETASHRCPYLKAPMVRSSSGAMPIAILAMCSPNCGGAGLFSRCARRIAAAQAYRARTANF